MIRSSDRPPRICMVSASYYPDDPRPRREAEALVQAGFGVDVICLRKEGEAGRERVGGVAVHRLPVRRSRAGRVRYLLDYALFFLLALFTLAALHPRRWYRIIHVHNMPDALVFCAILPRIAGARVILDLHDPMPEVYRTKYDLPAEHRVIRLLRFLERRSIAFADLVLTPNLAFRELFVDRGCPASKVHIIMNSPDPRIFAAREPEATAAGGAGGPR